jgi:hypothetical protein
MHVLCIFHGNPFALEPEMLPRRHLEAAMRG